MSGGGITRRISVNQESGGTVISIKGASAIQGRPTLVRANASDNVNTDVNVSLHWVYSPSSQSGDVVVTISSGENMSNIAQISANPLPNTVVTVTGVSPAKSSTQIYSYWKRTETNYLLYLHKPFEAMTLLVNYKESALILEESPIQQKYKQGTEGNLYQVGCSSVCLYKRLAMLSSMHRWQSHFLYI